MPSQEPGGVGDRWRPIGGFKLVCACSRLALCRTSKKGSLVSRTSTSFLKYMLRWGSSSDDSNAPNCSKNDFSVLKLQLYQVLGVRWGNQCASWTQAVGLASGQGVAICAENHVLLRWRRTQNIFAKVQRSGSDVRPRTQGVVLIFWGKLFYLQLELFCLQLGIFAYSPLLDALSHCEQKSSVRKLKL